MPTGPPPMPTALKILRGNPGKRRLNRAEPKPLVPATLEPPDWLAPKAQAQWRRLAPMLDRVGILTESDTETLAAYCEVFVTWREATDELRKTGILVKRKGLPPGIAPAVKIANYAGIQMRQLLVELGMTPSARSRIKVPPAAQEPVSKWGGLL